MGTATRFVVALDSGAVIALSRGNKAALATAREWASQGAEFLVPAPVLAETLRGGPKDAPVHRFLNSSSADIAELSAKAARRAGELLGASGSGSAHTVDALILATSIEYGASEIFTGDPKDLRRLADGAIAIEPI